MSLLGESVEAIRDRVRKLTFHAVAQLGAGMLRAILQVLPPLVSGVFTKLPKLDRTSKIS